MYENIFVLQDISQTHLSIYLLISLIRSEKTFATSLKSMTFHAIYPICIYFTHWRHDKHIFLLHNEWRSKHMYLLNITIICSYCGDAMKEMNRGIRSFFLFTIYTIQLWNRVRFCFFKSFTERRRCHTNNTYIQRVNIYTLLTQNHSDVRLEGHLIFRDFIEFERKKEKTYKKIDVIK